MNDTELSKVFADSVLPVTIFFGILALFGIFGNSCVLFVYKCRYPPCNFRTFVICLAATDLTSCLFVFPSEIVGHRIWFSYPKSAEWFCKLKTTIFGITVMTSALILLLISVDRFRKVCRPLHWQIKPKIAVYLCFATFATAVIMTVPIPILFGIQTQNITYAGDTVAISSCQKDNKYKDTNWMTIYVFSMYYTPVILFMVMTTVLYGLILRKFFSKSFLDGFHLPSLSRRQSSRAEGTCAKIQPSILSSDTLNDYTTTCETKYSDDTKDDREESTAEMQKVVIIDFESGQQDKVSPEKLNIFQDAPDLCEEEHTDLRQTDTDTNNVDSKQDNVKKIVKHPKQRITRKTIIMFIVTLIFNLTMLIYFSVLFVIVRKQHIFEIVSRDAAAILFLSWRIYFINHVINPVIYGLLDKRFRGVIQNRFCRS